MNYRTTLFTALAIGTLIFYHTTASYAANLNIYTGDTIRIDSAPFLPNNFHNEEVSIFIDGGYRGSEPSEFEWMLQGDWYDLYKNESTNEYILEKSDITIVKNYDDCLMDSTTFVTSRDAIAMINGLHFKNFKIKSFTPDITTVEPGKKLVFTFNNIEYTLRADGIYTDENNVYIVNDFIINQSHNEIINYKLYLYSQNKKQLLISVPQFNNTFVQILFIGDLDEDGKPDFIFDTSRDYEEKRVTLFLSSPAQDKEIVVPIDEASYVFDC